MSLRARAGGAGAGDLTRRTAALQAALEDALASGTIAGVPLTRPSARTRPPMWVRSFLLPPSLCSYEGEYNENKITGIGVFYYASGDR